MGLVKTADCSSTVLSVMLSVALLDQYFSFLPVVREPNVYGVNSSLNLSMGFWQFHFLNHLLASGSFVLLFSFWWWLQFSTAVLAL